MLVMAPLPPAVAAPPDHGTRPPPLPKPGSDQAAQSGRFSIQGSLFGVSDYRSRGVSQTRRRAALQASITASHALSRRFSLYLGNWNSTLYRDGGAGRVEVDLYGGGAMTMGATTVKLDAIGMIYPARGKGKANNYYRLRSEISRKIGPVSTSLGFHIVPKQKNFGNRVSTYLYLDATYPLPRTPFSFKAGIGHERSAHWTKKDGGPGRKLDWIVGAMVTERAINFGITYVDSNRQSQWPRRSGTSRNLAAGAVMADIGMAF